RAIAPAEAGLAGAARRARRTRRRAGRAPRQPRGGSRQGRLRTRRRIAAPHRPRLLGVGGRAVVWPVGGRGARCERLRLGRRPRSIARLAGVLPAFYRDLVTPWTL